MRRYAPGWLGCGLRRSELVALDISHFQQREEHWAIVDLVGKGGHVRTVPVPEWVKRAVGIASDASAGISETVSPDAPESPLLVRPESPDPRSLEPQHETPLHLHYMV